MRIAKIAVDGIRMTYAVVEKDYYQTIEGDIFGELKITHEKIL